MRRHVSVAASQEAAEARARSRHHPPPRPRLPLRPFSVRLHNPAPPRPSARLEGVLACLAAACSAALLPASSAQVYLALSCHMQPILAKAVGVRRRTRFLPPSTK